MESITLTFGKHSGKTLQTILTEDISYLTWLSKNAFQENIKNEALSLLPEPTKFTLDSPLEFGKHKGKSLNDLLNGKKKERSYIRFLMDCSRDEILELSISLKDDLDKRDLDEENKLKEILEKRKIKRERVLSSVDKSNRNNISELDSESFNSIFGIVPFSKYFSFEKGQILLENIISFEDDSDLTESQLLDFINYISSFILNNEKKLYIKTNLNITRNTLVKLSKLKPLLPLIESIKNIHWQRDYWKVTKKEPKKELELI